MVFALWIGSLRVATKPRRKGKSKAEAPSGQQRKVQKRERSRHIRVIAGAISWDKREESDKIKAYIEDVVKPINNPAQGLQEKSNINPLLQTLQLVLTHLQLNIPSLKASPALGFAYSQFAVYAHPDDFPMFSALAI